MKITALSPHQNSTEEQILAVISTLEADLIILPGNFENTPSLAKIRQALPDDTWIFVEPGEKMKGHSVVLSRSDTIKLPIQVFAELPGRQELSSLESCFPQRTVQIGKRSVSFIICGEINAFQQDGTTKSGIDLPFEILINPAHTVMGRWHILGRKLSALSHRGVVVHVANNNRKSPWISTGVRIYASGKQVGERGWNSVATWCTYTVPSTSKALG
ncbi:hypothetical protein V0R50_26405 [Pseudomonas sp. 148P]|uniref:Uncharacterized protein n=1 Tax=Pseudomonas ulcerans TaxID=3115852 RepID=A0ABU7HYZ4_9PSED|nr:MULTISPECIES: hypothetical protein [unclassified Pseudomonas]MEE1925316.1 hypothetical protein [Pseudomonas sp. 147P]MEE1936770.1 hypothetical protein [Pseudomonas sp. 148P]